MPDKTKSGATVGKAKADDDPLTDDTSEDADSDGMTMAASGTARVKGISQAEWDAAVLEDQATEEGE